MCHIIYIATLVSNITFVVVVVVGWSIYHGLESDFTAWNQRHVTTISDKMIVILRTIVRILERGKNFESGLMSKQSSKPSSILCRYCIVFLFFFHEKLAMAANNRFNKFPFSSKWRVTREIAYRVNLSSNQELHASYHISDMIIVEWRKKEKKRGERGEKVMEQY